MNIDYIYVPQALLNPTSITEDCVIVSDSIPVKDKLMTMKNKKIYRY